MGWFESSKCALFSLFFLNEIPLKQISVCIFALRSTLTLEGVAQSMGCVGFKLARTLSQISQFSLFFFSKVYREVVF